jgi:hypothetical protein
MGVVRNRPWFVIGVQIIVVVKAIVVVVVVDDDSVVIVRRPMIRVAGSPAWIINRVIRRRIIRPWPVPHSSVSPRRIVIIVAADR